MPVWGACAQQAGLRNPGRLPVTHSLLKLPALPQLAAAGGTLLYAAPEQLLGARCGPAADVFSLALLMLEVVTGRALQGRGFTAPDQQPQ